MKLYDAIPSHTKAFVFLKENLTLKERKFLAEAGLASDSDIENMLKSIAKELDAKNLTDKSPEDVDLDVIEKAKTEEGINEQQLNEGLILTLILASPTILKLLGKLIDWVYSKLALSSEERELLAQNKKNYAAAVKAGDKQKQKELEKQIHASGFAQDLSKLAHTAHEAFVWPIKKILQGVAWLNGNTWLKENAEPAAELIYAVIMIGVAGGGIIESVKSISATGLSAIGAKLGDVAHIVIDSVKGGDMSLEILKTVITKFLKA
jgi:hypothetical protein